MAELALVLTIGTERRSFKLTPAAPSLVVGRAPDVAVPLKAPLLSRRHCELRLENGALEVLDLGSANGTFVNGQRVQRARLQPGDLVQVGEVDVRLEFESGTWAADAAASADDLRCRRCGRRISMTTVGDGHTLEWSDEVLCPACRDAGPGDDGAQGRLAELLARDGYEVLGTISPHPTPSPVLRARRRGAGPDAELFAIKVLPLAAGLSTKKIDRFKAEARALAQIDHPNVVRVRAVLERPELLAIVLEHVDGKSLLDMIERRGRLSARDALHVGIAIARALEAAAARGIVHRNVKPANILIGRNGRPWLVDFGLAKGVSSSGPGVTGMDEMLGTIRYMAPEQVKDARAADGRSDVYSLAATLFHAFTGKLPYPYHSELDLLRSTITGSLPSFAPTPVDPLPEGVGPLLARSLQRDPKARPQAAELAEELDRIAAEVRAQSPPTPAPQGRASDSRTFSVPTPSFGTSTRAFRSRPATGPTRTGPFTGDELHVLVRGLAAASESGVLEVRAGGSEVGVLSIRDGKVVLARTPGGRRGESAALEVLGTRDGEFAFHPGIAGDVESEHELALSPLVLEAARRRAQGGSAR